ncbi:MAG: hypothetical protein JNK46_14070 [Methylobacteriaceae bacterium]|nr:hypothetical protein [Methylobacteriaceae bacterium]
MRDRALLIAATFVAALTLAAGAALVWSLWRRPSGAPALIEATIGRTRLAMSADYARFEADRAGGPLDRLDLAARFPEFTPAGRPDSRPGGEPGGRDERLIFVTLTPEDGALDPAERPVRLYARFLDATVWTHPGGLLMRRFQPNTPYAGEELYIAPPEGRAFFARCPTPGAAGDGLPDFCFTEMRAAGLALQVRFAPALLSEWERVAEGVRALLRQIARP